MTSHFLAAQGTAANHPWVRLAKAFVDSSGSSKDVALSMGLLLAGLATALGLLYVLGLVQRRRRAPVGPRPRRLFRRLLRELRLPLLDRVLLMLFARASGMEQPTAMLLSPTLLREQAEAWAGRAVIPGMKALALERTAAISWKLFGAGPSAAPSGRAAKR